MRKRNDARSRLSTALFVALAVLVMAGWSGIASAQDPPEGTWFCSYSLSTGSSTYSVHFYLSLRKTSATTAEIYDGSGTVIASGGGFRVLKLRVLPGGVFSTTPGGTITFSTDSVPPPGLVFQESWSVVNSGPLNFTVQSGALNPVSPGGGGSGTCFLSR